MKIEINLKIIIILLLSFIIKNIEAYMIFMLFILIHEIAHLVVGICIGGIPEKISLNPFGVSLELYLYGKIKSFKKIIFYISGPMINFLIAMILLKYINYNKYFFIIIYTNLAIFLLNLIPIYPLDGGKILKELLKILIGQEKSNRLVMILSRIFLIIITFGYSILIIKIKNIYILLLIIYLWYIFLIEEKRYSIYEKVVKIIKQNE